MTRDAERGEPAGATGATYYYRHGLAVLRHVREAPPWMRYDDRVDAYIAPGHRLPELRAWAEARGIEAGGAAEAAADPASGPAPAPWRGPLPFYDPRSPRPYQEDAVTRWEAAGGRGSVVLPTGSGKTFVAILAIHRTLGGGEGRACVVAPTRALVAQWYAQLADAFGAERVGAYYADEKDVRALKVTTYHSAFDLLEREGAHVRLLVLDEAHHLEDTAAGEPKAWHDALRIAPAPYRLGLTATYPDGRDSELRRLVGGVVYRRAVAEMADAELADFALARRFVELTPAERERYDAADAAYEGYFERKGLRQRYPAPGDAWRVFMAETRRSPAARRAFRAFLERERVVTLAENKLRETYRILGLHSAERAVLFTGNVAAAESLSERLAVPVITADTPASERKRLLESMADGRIRAVASVRVLDEGWDVPAAKLGVILGDSSRGGRRQYQQRLGRILRRQGEHVASLYEVVAAGTYELFASQKRRSGLTRGPDPQLGLGL
ncbi:MAG: DEAD/DEAH box helicase [Gemmatimonadota bacterium]